MEALALTADHAVRGKLAAVSEGYWADEFVRHFTHGGAYETSPGPMINRGQYARVSAISSVVEQFITSTAGQSAQIISLGAGYDSLFWQLQAAGVAPSLYVEIDQDEVVQRKSSIIRSKSSLLAALPEGAACVTPKGITSGSAGYRLLAVDLHEIATLETALTGAGWMPSAPTLVIAECLLVYMVPNVSRALLEFFGNRCPSAVLVTYEMVHPDDPFGRMMLDNLRRRGCPLLGLVAVPDVAAQRERCLACGWGRAEAVEMLSYWEEVVSSEERKRVSRLGMLDELEEWRLLLGHYCVTLAVRDGASAPLFEGMALRKPVTSPPLAALRSDVRGGSTVEGTHTGIDTIESATARGPQGKPPQGKPPPLGDTFHEEDEDAVWSDEEEPSSAEGGSAAAAPLDLQQPAHADGL